MKNFFLLLLLSSVAIFGAGCKNNQSAQTNIPSSTTPIVDVTPNQTTTPPVATKEKVLYRGSWFDIEYPENFTASPTSPSYTAESGDIRIKTNEAKFFSPDGAVEFFVFSPLWGGDPFDYLKVKDKEILVSDETTQTGSDIDTKITRWVTIKAKDNSYYRSFVSIKDHVGSGSDTHYVLGIKYKDNTTYDAYKNAYLAFKDSLRQYAD